jgi:mannitol-1-phosphate/altronate dehydrogenase
MANSFVGFGFGPIQSALFLYEAFRSGNFSRYVVAEIDRELLQAVQEAGGRYTVNIARRDRIDRDTVAGVELFDPREPGDFRRIAAAVAEAHEMCTALPSVQAYGAGGQISVVRQLAAGLSARRPGLPAVLYAAENHNRAAELLLQQLEPLAAPEVLQHVQLLNTVIGKMSGVITDAQTIRRLGLATITPQVPRAILVEEFNRILVSKVRLPGFRRGIEVFVEKEQLLPFEEAKLYGHNAIHALIAYLADVAGYRTMAEAGGDAFIMDTARGAFLEESGAALIRRHSGLGDPQFTEPGYRAYAEDLLRRMVNPYLNDLVERVGRDHVRKLGLEDRLFGTMVIALEQGLEPGRLALGAAAGVWSLIRRRGGPKEAPPGLSPLPARPEGLTRGALRGLLFGLWGESPGRDRHGERLVELTWQAWARLRWQHRGRGGKPPAGSAEGSGREDPRG